MKVAKEKVWADAKGNLVPDGHEDAAFLVATAGKVVPDAHAEQYKGHDKFFKDAVLDRDGKPEQQDRPVAATGVTYNMIKDHSDAPAPQNREDANPKLAKRDKNAPAKKKAEK